MGRRRKAESRSMEIAKKRIAGLQSIDPALDFGSGKSIVGYLEKLATAETNLNVYNTKLAELDELLNNFMLASKELSAFNTEMLAAVKALYGRDSNEYEKAGGTRYSERKRPQKSGE
jgi:hypothetical protein